jgi:polyadenylate-binding protein 2
MTTAEDETAEIEALKKKVKELEEEDEKLRKLHEDIESGSELEIDSRSIFIGNVDYSTTPEELQQYFHSCGTINRVTILCDRYKNPKGFAYIEFTEKDSVANALLLNETLFKGRQLKVSAKRTNVPGYKTPRPRFPPPYYTRVPYYSVPRPRRRPRVPYYHPYS